MAKVRIVNPEKVDDNLKDPRGWNIKNNPHPNEWVTDPTDEKDWRNWFEWDEDSLHPTVCHNCIKRAKIGSGNCQNGGDYFICLPKDVRDGKKLIKQTTQVALDGF